MYLGRLERDGMTIADKVRVRLHELSLPGGLKCWKGLYLSDLASHPEPGEKLRLILSDGRSGDIIILSIKITGSREVPVEFEVTGPLE